MAEALLRSAQDWKQEGDELQRQGRFDNAINCYQKAVELDPGFAKAMNNCAAAFARMGLEEDAAEWFGRALAVDPTNEGTLANLAQLQAKLKRYEEILSFASAALAVDPECVQAMRNKSTAYVLLGSFEDAEYWAAKLLRHTSEDTDDLQLLYTRINAYAQLGDFEGYLAACRKAIALSPRTGSFHVDYAYTLLLLGRFREGWAEYEWRPQKRHWNYDTPPWNGKPLPNPGDKLLLVVEQGRGDAIQFSRYALKLADEGYEILLEVFSELLGLFKLGLVHKRITIIPCIESTTEIHEGLQFAAFAPLMSLPHILGTEPDTIPDYVPYLCAPQQRIEHWRTRLKGSPGKLRVGLVWAGSPEHPNDSERSIPIETVIPLTQVEGVDFYSLRKGKWDLAAFPAGSVMDLGERIGDFSDTAAILENLDLIISVDTAVAHLAGAMNKPVWTLITWTPDFRWMLNSETTPWYPSMRLFRQTKRGDWTGVVTEVATELAGLVTARRE